MYFDVWQYITCSDCAVYCVVHFIYVPINKPPLLTLTKVLRMPYVFPLKRDKTSKTVNHNVAVFVNWFKVKSSKVANTQGFVCFIIGPLMIQRRVVVDVNYKNKTMTSVLLRKQK
jgi:hypothetical protein